MTYVIKRDGTRVPFDRAKIRIAIWEAKHISRTRRTEKEL